MSRDLFPMRATSFEDLTGPRHLPTTRDPSAVRSALKPEPHGRPPSRTARRELGERRSPSRASGDRLSQQRRAQRDSRQRKGLWDFNLQGNEQMSASCW